VNNHKNGAIVAKHELGSSPYCHVFESGDRVQVADVRFDTVHLYYSIRVLQIAGRALEVDWTKAKFAKKKSP